MRLWRKDTRRFWRWLADYAAKRATPGRRPDGADAGGGPPTSPRRRESDGLASPVSLEDCAKRLRGVLNRQGRATTGAVHFVDLKHLREILGERWENHQEKLETLSTRLIQNRLAPDDMFVPLEGPVFLIVFNSLSPAQAKVKCALIARDIERQVLGQDAGQGTVVRAAVATLDKNAPVEALNLDSLAHAIIYRHEAHGHDRDSDRDSNRDRDFDDCTAQDGVSGSDHGGDGAPDSDPSLAWEAFHRKPMDEDFLAFLDSVEVEPMPPPVQFIYRPMWQAQQKVMALYHCLPVWAGPDESMIVGDDRRAGLLIDNLDVDRAVLEHVIQDFNALRSQDIRLFISVPVTFETLATHAARNAYLETCRKVEEEDRHYLMFELVDLPTGVAASRLAHLSTVLRPWCRAVLARVPIGERRLEKYRDARIMAVGLDVRGAAHYEEKLIADMNRFVEVASRAGLRTYVHNLRSLSLTAAAVAAGFDFVDGDAVLSLKDVPDLARRFSAEDLYGPLIKAMAPQPGRDASSGGGHGRS